MTKDGVSKNGRHLNIDTFFKRLTFLAYSYLSCSDLYNVHEAQRRFQLILQYFLCWIAAWRRRGLYYLPSFMLLFSYLQWQPDLAVRQLYIEKYRSFCSDRSTPASASNRGHCILNISPFTQRNPKNLNSLRGIYMSSNSSCKKSNSSSRGTEVFEWELMDIFQISVSRSLHAGK